MNKKLIQQLEKKLKEDKEAIEKQLKSFAEEDKTLKGDWDTRFPQLDGESKETDLEGAADQVEEYSSLLPIEHSLEKKLQNIESALKRISRGSYGICEKCKKEISIERLKAFPTARTCKKCK